MKYTTSSLRQQTYKFAFPEYVVCFDKAINAIYVTSEYVEASSEEPYEELKVEIRGVDLTSSGKPDKRQKDGYLSFSYDRYFIASLLMHKIGEVVLALKLKQEWEEALSRNRTVRGLNLTPEQFEKFKQETEKTLLDNYQAEKLAQF